ncbi:enolase C-terminal domain-like protein [Paenibacillus eucommiae]|uniref:L-alanine-DL-glutamate epimerase-like enolase superfamily enzyme n=1 Tax=Paenibacillus eucommiae TaxID=1355755 RepID=A0ABS4IT21_9BACL|nr:enolase C-terminal domain-like protein [Paenibacillus eucommiae]MBP1990724.1 L-alanine-DL-glutamate epimerase-like enolase superfamily enzyme [Paenibacillus eucommiae]
MIRVIETNHAIQKEPLLSPFGFKGAYLSELWQSAVGLRGADGAYGIGVGVQSVLWSDSKVFEQHGEAAGNQLMSDITQFALNAVERTSFDTPIDLLDSILPEVSAFARTKSGIDNLYETFVLNALVPVDQAAWALYSRGKNQSFAELVPETYRGALGQRQPQLASIPLIPYGMSAADIEQMLNEGYFLLKIKLGADPDQDNDQEKMLEWDKRRLTQIHEIAERYETAYTHSGKIAYYLDANGRYDGKERLLRLLEHAGQIGALERIVLFEEPFPQSLEVNVADLPVRLAADESVHDEHDALARIEMGYGAFALKPVAKTMSLSLKVAKLAFKHNVPCFCADLTANPLLADWNKNLASLLAPLPELKIGVIETNGHQNYRSWEQMKSYHPLANAEWIEAVNGIYQLSDSFYAANGGALEISPYYEAVLQNKGES